MKYSFEDAARLAFISIAGFFRSPVIEIRVTDSNVVADYKARINRSALAYDELKQKYDNVSAAYARECQINLKLQDDLRLLKKGK